MTTDVRDVLRDPVVVAPMAGGPSTPALVVAAAEAGSLAFLPAGYRTADQLRDDLATVVAGTAQPFGVNVFVPGEPAVDRSAVDRYLDGLQAQGYDVGPSRWDDDDWDAKVEVLRELRPPVVTFTFGVPPRSLVDDLTAGGSAVGVTVTSPGDAAAAVASGAGFLCVQGPEAGAHRGTFAVAAVPDERPLPRLVADVAAVTDVPLIVAGGIATREDVAGALALGAAAVMCGTAFVRCTESGARQAYKDALVDPRYTETVVTRAFSGRPARGLRNRFIDEHPDPPAGYPEINNATRPLRAAGDAETMSLWAGTGWRHAVDGSVAAALDQLRPVR